MAAAFRGLNAPLSTPQWIVLGIMLAGLISVGIMAAWVAYDMWRDGAQRVGSGNQETDAKRADTTRRSAAQESHSHSISPAPPGDHP